MYVLYVQGGKELQIIEELRRKKITAYSPRQIKAERRRGKWQYVERIIFTGYVFIDVSELTAKLWHIIMKCSGAIRFVSLCALPDNEDAYIRKLCNDGNCIDVSRGYISDGILHVTSGFMTNLDHEIVKFNRRGRRASADVTLYGEKHRIVFSVEFDNPPALP